MECIFCKVANGEMETQLVYQDQLVVAFDDLYPKAPQHKLIVPREHFATLNEVDDEHLVGHIFMVAKKLAKEAEIAESGYRVVVNCNKEGGQEIYHLHFHLLGGRALRGLG